MAINLDVQDLDNYPGIVKRVTLDMDSIVPVGTNGDEKNMLTASTTAYSDIANRTAIQGLYVMGAVVGWTKSSGFKGAAGKFQLAASNNKLGIKLDSTVSGTYTYGTGSYYEVALEYEDTPKAGVDIAEDMQAKIRAIVCSAGDEGFQLAYKNADVEFDGNKFYIASGTISSSFTGTLKTSARVAPAMSEDCTAILGFDQQLTSEDVAAVTAVETILTADYSLGTTPLTIGLNTGIAAGDSFYITDGVNSDYCTALAVNDAQVTVPVSGTNSFNGITNDYTVASGTFIQLLRRQDPESKPQSYCEDVDELTRFMAKSIINQIDFSS